MVLEKSRAKKRPTIKQLIQNTTKVLGYPPKQDRDISIGKVIPFAGTKFVKFQAMSTGEGNKKYNLSATFYGVSFSQEKDKAHPLPIKQKPTGGPTRTVYMEPLNSSKHGVSVFCTCPWFRFASEWYLKKDNALDQGHKPRPYKRKTKTRPSINPKKLPCMCKHTYMFTLELQKRGFMIRE